MKNNYTSPKITLLFFIIISFSLSACNQQRATATAIPTEITKVKIDTSTPSSTSKPTLAPIPTAVVDLCPALTSFTKQATHPLDALSNHEITCTIAILQNAELVDPQSRYPMLTLQEPDKSFVLSWQRGDDISRSAFAVVKQGLNIYEAVVDITGQEVVSWTEMMGVGSNVLAEESESARKIVFETPDFQEALAQRGITEEGQVQCIGITVGSFGLPEEEGTRLIGLPCYDKRGDGSFWNRPIEGLFPIVDLNAEVLFKLINTETIPIADNPALPKSQADGVDPIAFAYDYPKFETDPNWIEWQNWSFHLRFDRRVGTIISQIAYQDGDAKRPILYQGSLSEVFVPYMDPTEAWYRRTFLDAGEYGFGVSATSLEMGIDCPIEAEYIDPVIVTDNGNPYRIPGAICIFERTHGDPAWRHYDPSVGQMHEGHFATELVVRMLGTVGNYDYYLDWVFTEDGRVRVGVGSTGIVLTKGVESKSMADETAANDTAYGSLIAPNIVAPNHDHFFNFRLDFDVDGVENSFMKGKLVPEIVEGQPRKSYWALERTIAQSEGQAKSLIDPTTPTMYHVMNPNTQGELGHSPSYMLKPMGTFAYSLLHPDDYPQQRAGFTDYHIWVTPYAPNERYAAGDYVFQSEGGGGLPAWTQADRPIENRDIVLWYTMGFHHVPRLEDWPVMPLHWQQFELVPFNFFDGNPAVEVENE